MSIATGDESIPRQTLSLPDEISLANVSSLLADVNQLAEGGALDLDCGGVERCDSAGVAFLNHVRSMYPGTDLIGVPANLKILLDKFPAQSGRRVGASPRVHRRGLLEYLMLKIGRVWRNTLKYLVLLTDEIYYTVQFVIHARKRRGVFPGEIMNQLYYMAYDSFPIVCLISFLVGLTIAISSLEQLKMFGAEIYLADLVGFGMIRELVPIMTGIILAGKIGASITAEISSMVVLEEVDALRTMGVVPERFLMVPRLIAITMAVPLLVGMADVVGIFGGILVGRFLANIPVSVFLNQMFTIVTVTDLLIGLGKTLIFGWAVVISAGYKGFSAGRGAQGVGISTTESVVLSISLIIILDCIFALILY
jgi:phospholipid/cholesterol/gamma-HCH transport system permease protein